MPLPYVIAPAGVTPASAHVPSNVVSAARPPAILADNIDPATGDFFSLLIPIHPVDAAIQEQFRLRRGSGAAVQEDGQAFHEIRKNTEFAATEIQHEAQRVMKPFVDRGDALVVQITVDTDEAPDMGAVLVRYVNLRSGQPQTVPPST